MRLLHRLLRVVVRLGRLVAMLATWRAHVRSRIVRVLSLIVAWRKLITPTSLIDRMVR